MEPDIRIMPEGFGGLAYKDITNIHPLAVIAVVVLGIAMLTVPRRLSVIPMFILACFISSVQKITVVGLDFTLLRIMVLFGVSRLILRKESIDFEWKSLDTVVSLWIVSSMLIFTLQQGTFSAFVNRLGFGFDAFGMYFLFRCLIRDWQDVDTVVLAILFISIPLAVFFLLEQRTGRNVFSAFGGVPEFTMIRQGRLRCQGAFPHPVIAGCFWASMMPLFAARWWKSTNDRFWAVTGLVASSVVVVCSASSTPVMGVLSALVGASCFLLRRYMRLVRWGVLLTLIALHMVMEAPVWHLIGRVSAIGGSTGYFRYLLINGAIEHFHEWALLGTKSTAHWFWGAQDVTQYVYEGVTGGFVTLCLFVAVISVSFREVGKLWRCQVHHPYHLAMSWALGVSLFVHCSQFIGASYFGQIWLVWYLLLAMIGSLSSTSVLKNE